ncbi:PLD-like domain-containing protein [Bhargavaea beijingensis]|uniref:phospholipase D n=1 Tax=Bhargavaea beijingensis TaxID=426756 RepID=A0A1G6XKM5_9BACL|nr:phospholipase D-like domain-containing protein [Bhargavaea beijingensis]SDD78621.1 PLD-like domain-containing protein [Bhargavaea beijingensis]
MEAHFYLPHSESFVKNPKGSAPPFVDLLIKELNDAKEIYISLFLFNNISLYRALKRLAELGTLINIYTIPLNGYDDKKVRAFDGSKSIDVSKRQYAEWIVKDIITENININYYLVPHTNLWSKQKASRGNNSYALHNKSILVRYHNDTYKCISTSSNLAVGDPEKSENLLIIDRNSDIAMFKKYFELLGENSIKLDNYQKFRSKHEDSHLITTPINLRDDYESCYFTAPFIKYNNQGSNHFVQNKIIKFIASSKRRLFICSQHFSDINSYDRNSKSTVKAIMDIARKNPRLEVKIIKQTRESHQAQGGRSTEAEEALIGFPNVEMKFWYPVLHDKFIIVDDEILITTANFTPTQFAWAEKHRMRYHDKEIINTFSDINSFHFVNDKDLTDSYISHFNSLWDRGERISL